MSHQFVSKLHSGLQTVRLWENKDLLEKCRSEIPFNELCPEQYYYFAGDEHSTKISPYAKEDDYKYQGDDLLLKRLTKYFQSIMTWVNNPPCDLCGSKETKYRSGRGPLTPEERNGQANRVEIYFCQNCNAETTTFPRYNNPVKLLETKKGRCGEYANLFGVFCKSTGFETRYIMDFTDHVWVEVWSNETNRWIMADGCEGTIDEPGMYENGWGKSLCYNIAFTIDSVTDVTKRYTRKFNSPEFQSRRRNFTPGGESQSDMLVAQFNSMARNSRNVSRSRIIELDKREHSEKKLLDETLKLDSWGSSSYNEGRISGSLAWRISRGEAGKNIGNDGISGNGALTTSQVTSDMYYIDCFHPMPYHSKDCTIDFVAPLNKVQGNFAECITVMGTSCGSGIPDSISIVVVDEKYSCILQSKVFHIWTDAFMFLSKLPEQRIVALFSDLKMSSDDKEFFKVKNVELDGFDIIIQADIDKNENQYFIFTGQINRNPEWTLCQKISGGSKVRVSIDLQTDGTLSNFKLQRRNSCTPQRVSMRLPDSFLSLQSQLIANEEDKKTAFDRFMQQEIKKVEENTYCYTGFVTQDNAPVYLLSKDAFPFNPCKSVDPSNGNWITYHYVPEPMWYEEEVTDQEKGSDNLDVDVPIDEGLFISMLGNTLLKKENNTHIEVSTVAALSNTRLIALYFSAHWCPPCRNFTPLLCKMYEHLKRVFPTYGLEVIFVSSDRDETSFGIYYQSMPWLALPWNDEGKAIRRRIAESLSIQGIPSLVVFDSISGTIVIPKEQSSNDVIRACQHGDHAIEQLLQIWLSHLPVESKNMMDMLKMSVVENMDSISDTKPVSNKYLEKSQRVEHEHVAVVMSKDEQAAKVKEYFLKLIAQGLGNNEAAVQAINKVAEEIKKTKEKGIMTGSLRGWKCNAQTDLQRVTPRHEELINVLEIAKRYVDNVRKNPMSYRLRNVKLSNTIFDGITSTKGGLEYVTSNLAFRVRSTDSDFFASIPLGVDIDALRKRIDDILNKLH